MQCSLSTPLLQIMAKLKQCVYSYIKCRITFNKLRVCWPHPAFHYGLTQLLPLMPCMDCSHTWPSLIPLTDVHNHSIYMPGHWLLSLHSPTHITTHWPIFYSCPVLCADNSLDFVYSHWLSHQHKTVSPLLHRCITVFSSHSCIITHSLTNICQVHHWTIQDVYLCIRTHSPLTCDFHSTCTKYLFMYYFPVLSLTPITVVINTNCEGVYPVTNARAWGIYYYYKDRPTWLKEISLYFYEVTQTREPPYCFECMIALVKVDEFPNEKFETTLPFFCGRLFEVLLPADSMRTDRF